MLRALLSAFTLKLLVVYRALHGARMDHVDLNVLFFTLGVSVVTGLIFGSIRVLEAAGHGAGARVDDQPLGAALRSVLIVAQSARRSCC